MSLWDWLEAYVDPAHKAMTPEIAATASLHCYAESVLAGTTSVMDMWRFMEGSAAAAETIGLRATLVPYVADGEFDYFETLESNRRLLETHRTAADGRVRTWVGLEHLFYCSEQCFARRPRAGRGVRHRHPHALVGVDLGGAGVVEALRPPAARGVPPARHPHRPHGGGALRVARRPRDPAARADRHRGRALPVLEHEAGVGAGARSARCRRRACVVGIGSDGEKENNNLDLVEEMKFASLLQKVSTLDPTAGDPWEVLAMATIDGARALGLDDVTGSLVAGKRADVITVALDGLHTTPVLHGRDFNVAAHLVFSASGRDVRDVWVDGHRLVAGGAPTTFDVASVREQAQAAAEELFERRAKVLASS